MKIARRIPMKRELKENQKADGLLSSLPNCKAHPDEKGTESYNLPICPPNPGMQLQSASR